MAHHRKTEADTDPDEAVADSRETGGVPDETHANQNSTTDTTPTPDYVGRIAGDDVGYAEETGAERRAEAEQQ